MRPTKNSTKSRKGQFPMHIWCPSKFSGTVQVSGSDKVSKVLKDIVQRFPQHFNKSDLKDMRLAYNGRILSNDSEIVGNVELSRETVIVLKGITQQLPLCPEHSLELICYSKRGNYMVCYECWCADLEHDESVIPIGEIPEPEKTKIIEEAKKLSEEEAQESNLWFKTSAQPIPGPAIRKSLKRSIPQDRNLVLQLAETGESKRLEDYIEFVVDEVNIPNEKGVWAMHVAAHANRPEIINMLLKNGCRPDEYTVSGMTPLLAACHKQNSEAALALIAGDCDTSLATADGTTALHVALQWGNKEIINKILSKGYHDTRGPNGVTPLMMAAGLGLEETFLSKMISRKTVAARDDIGRTPLMFSTTWDTIELFIRGDANMHARDYAGNSALMHLLTRPLCPNVVSLFISANVNINEKCSAKNTALYTLVAQSAKYFPGSGQESKGTPEDLNNFKLTLQRLLENGSDPNIGNSPLHVAVHNLDVFKSIWSKSNEQNRRSLSTGNPKGRTLIMSAAASPSGLDVIRFLISKKLPVDMETVDSNGDSILTIAAGSGCTENVQFLYFHLLTSRSTTDAPLQSVRKSLFDSVTNAVLSSQRLVASNSVHTLLSKILSGTMSKKNESLDCDASQLIYKACKYICKMPVTQHSNLEVMELLQSWGGKINYLNENNRSALFYVTDAKVAEFLIKQLGDSEPIDSSGNGLLHALIENDNNIRNPSSDKTPLDWRILNQVDDSELKERRQDHMFTITKMFLLKGCSLSTRNSSGITVLESAVIKLSRTSLMCFFDAISECRMNEITEEDYPQLMKYTISRSHKPDFCLRLLIHTFEESLQKWSGSAIEKTLLEYLEMGSKCTLLVSHNLIKLLRSVSKDVINRIIVIDDWFCFRIAFQKVVQSLDVEYVLLKCLETDSVSILGGLINCVKIENIMMSDYGIEGLPASAISHKATKCVEFLLQQSSCETNRRLINGDTLLHRAVESGSYLCVEIVLSGGGRRSTKNSDGKTPIMCAIIRNEPEMVALLITSDGKLQSYVDLAISHGHEEVIHALLSDEPRRKLPVLQTKDPFGW